MISQERLKEVLYYNGGDLIRRITTSGRAKKGDLAGSVGRGGYLKTFIDGRSYLNHRLVFLYHKGYLPKYLDHANGIVTDNRIENLRPCTRSQNRMNSRVRINNTSGVKGLSWHKAAGKWGAYIAINGRQTHLGLFWDKEVAAQVVRIERGRLHGEFANNG